jgi:uncharacterized membrane protein
MKQLARWFLQGLIVLLPLATTIWVVTHVFNEIDALFRVPRPGHEGEEVPGLGFVLALVTITATGWLASFFFGRWLVRLTDWLIARIPVINTIYRIAKDILQAVAGDNKTFDRPVVVSLDPAGAVKLLGFVTREDLAAIGLPGDVAVLMQQSFGFSANLLVFPKSQVRAIDVDSGRFLTFIISGGLTGTFEKTPAADPVPRLHAPKPKG